MICDVTIYLTYNNDCIQAWNEAVHITKTTFSSTLTGLKSKYTGFLTGIGFQKLFTNYLARVRELQ